MLDPHDRQLLRDVLRPPSGFEFDRAVVTTYSLDLMTLLTVPLAFTFFQLKDHEGPPSADPLALLEALRRHASRITLFCQAGQIHLPKNVQLLLGYLEGSVFEAVAPRGGVFHPKLTVLRYRAAPSAHEAAEEPRAVLYRVLCSSRNLTFDRSWDTLLVIDGSLSRNRKNAYAPNRPLARFVEALPRLVSRPVEPERFAHLSEIADELLRVDFEVPDGFDEMEFFPMGVEGRPQWPMLDYGRTAVMAPFVSDEFIQTLADAGGEHHLISRHDSLEELSEDSLAALASAHYMNTAVDPADTDAAHDAQADAAGEKPSDDRQVALQPSLQLAGLHAKLFIADDGWDAHVWTGSANATAAAFERNVEFLVRLRGKKSRCGIARLIDVGGEDHDDAPAAGRDRSIRFADFLLQYKRSGQPAVDAPLKRLEDALDRTTAALACAKFTGSIQGIEGQADRFCLSLDVSDGAEVIWPTGVTVECSPITLREGFEPLAQPLRSAVTTFTPLSFEALTTFIGFRLRARENDRERSCGFVLNVPMTGMPADRQGRILLSLLRNREQLLRYLLMLLADDEDAAAQATEIFQSRSSRQDQDGNRAGFGLPLLEPLLQALDRHPARLQQIARLIDDLQATPEGRTLVTDDFLHIWRPIWETARLMRGSQADE